MKEFLISLCLGTNEIPKKYASIYEQIKSCGAVQNLRNKKHHNVFKLHSKFGIFSVCKPKSPLAKSIFLQDITKSRNDIRLSPQSSPKSLENGEIVLVLLAGKFVRIIKSLSSAKPTKKQHLIYLEKQKGKIIGINFQDGEISTLPFSQKSLEQLPYHCVFSYENIKPKINKIYGVLEESKVDEAIALFLADRKEEFSQEAKQLAQSFGNRVEPSLYMDSSGGLCSDKVGEFSGRIGSRVDLSKLDFITIDPSDAKDHDDAIYYDEKSKVLYVAIADVSEYVLPKTALDEEAKQRLFSLYFPHKCHPMLPQELSENLCSLKANELKLALVCEIHFCTTSPRKITPKSTKIYQALITPKANVSYEYIDNLLDALESAKKSSTILKPLKNLANPRWILSFWHIASRLKNERLKTGFDFFTKERKMILDKYGEIESIRTILPTRAHSLIEEAMLLANVSVARILDNALGGKGIYRTHNPPTKDRLHALFGEIAQLGYTIEKTKKASNDYSKNIHSQIIYLQSLANTQQDKEIIDKLIIKSQKEARYEDSKNEHFGLGFEAYTHFTSPIRRYSDILAHRLIKLLLRSSGVLDIDFAKNQSISKQKTKRLQNGLQEKNEKEFERKNEREFERDFEIARHINFTLESIRIATPLLNDAERAIAKCEMCFKDRKYARSAQKWQGESIYIRIIDERFPAIGVVDFTDSSAGFGIYFSEAKSKETHSHTPLAANHLPNATLQEILQGARVFVLDSSLQKHATYLAQITKVELGSARIFASVFANVPANTLDRSAQIDFTKNPKSTKNTTPKPKHKLSKKTKNNQTKKHKKQIKQKSNQKSNNV